MTDGRELRILIVDDEAPARSKTALFVGRLRADARISEANDGLEAVRKIEQEHPDLVFLDIQMPGMTGLDVIESIGPERMMPVIFVTAYDEYAVRAFELQALDYLLKPFDEVRFQKAFQRALDHRLQSNFSAGPLKELLSYLRSAEPHLRKLVVREKDRIVLVGLDEVMSISAEDKYVKVALAGKEYLVRSSLNALEDRLDPGKFRRIHRAHFVNVDFVRELLPWSHGDYIVVLESGKQLPMSRRYSGNLI